MAKYEKQMFDIVNRHRAVASTVARISKNLDCDILARKLSAISARRKNK